MPSWDHIVFPIANALLTIVLFAVNYLIARRDARQQLVREEERDHQAALLTKLTDLNKLAAVYKERVETIAELFREAGVRLDQQCGQVRAVEACFVAKLYLRIRMGAVQSATAKSEITLARDYLINFWRQVQVLNIPDTWFDCTMNGIRNAVYLNRAVCVYNALSPLELAYQVHEPYQKHTGSYKLYNEHISLQYCRKQVERLDTSKAKLLLSAQELENLEQELIDYKMMLTNL